MESSYSYRYPTEEEHLRVSIGMLNELNANKVIMIVLSVFCGFMMLLGIMFGTVSTQQVTKLISIPIVIFSLAVILWGIKESNKVKKMIRLIEAKEYQVLDCIADRIDNKSGFDSASGASSYSYVVYLKDIQGKSIP